MACMEFARQGSDHELSEMEARAGKPRTGRTIYVELGRTFTQADVSDGLTAALRGRLEHVRPFAAEESAQGRAAENLRLICVRLCPNTREDRRSPDTSRRGGTTLVET